MGNSPEEKSKGRSGQENIKPYVKYSGMAFQMIGVMVLAAFAGRKLDAYFHTANPWFTIALLVAAVVGSTILVIVSLTKKEK